MKLTDILKDVLVEAKKQTLAARNSDRKEGPISSTVKEGIKNVIEHRWLCYLKYRGDSENAPGNRWCEIYVWGHNRYTQNEVIRLWQYRGKSTTIERGWKMFRLDRISSLAPLTTKTFDKPRPLYHADDKLMSGIKMAVDFSKTDKNKNTVKRLRKGKI